MSANWEQVTAIFGASRLLGAETRRQFLDAACAQDVLLRERVEALLSADVDDGFLEQAPLAAWAEAFGRGDQVLSAGEVVKQRYRIVRRLAEGGQALVYAAEDQLLNRIVVMKVMRGSPGDNAVLRKRFEREMQALARIEHPGVVGIIDVGELTGGSPFLIVQFVDGESLRELMRREPLSPRRVATIVRQVGAALAAAHASGVAHQDIKPENIMVQPRSQADDLVRLIDFGIAKVVQQEGAAGLTTITVAGTVRYMAPEQFQGENSPASDVYALALVCCEMLGGQPDPRVLPTVPRAVRRLIDDALARDPAKRPARIGLWSEQLAASLSGESRVWQHRGALAAFGFAAFIGGVAFTPLSRSEPEVDSRIIEKVGAFDPLEEDFRIHNELVGTVVADGRNETYEAWRVSTPRMGHYFRNLTDAQKRAALKQGWTLSTRARVEEGQAFAVIDFIGVGHRYDLNLLRDGADDIVRLGTQIVPVRQGLDYRRPHDDLYHLYEIRFDPGREDASLWIDGLQVLSGYRGHSQFQTDGDLIFGAATYRTEKGVGAFQLVRFAIHP